MYVRTRSLVHRPTKLSILVLLASILAPCLSGCLRYTPSRSELAQKHDKNPHATSLDLGGEIEFAAYENTLASRLHNLIESRLHLLDNATGNAGGYAIGTGDLIGVQVYGFSDLTSEVEVSPSGAVSLPLVGQASVGGLELPEVRKKLTADYARYIRAPQVEVTLKSYNTSRVSIIGEVAKPGMYPLKRKGQLLTELLSEAGGRTQVASNRLILLPAQSLNSGSSRLTEPNATTPTLTLTSMQHPSSYGVEIEVEALIGGIDQRPLLVPLLPGDTVVIPEVGNYDVDGEVAKPGSYKLASRTSAMGAIAAAGGFTYSANVNQVEVIRDIGAGRKALITLDLEEVGFRGGRDIRLRNGDIVRVPSEPSRFFRQQTLEAINSLFNGVGVTQRVN